MVSIPPRTALRAHIGVIIEGLCHPTLPQATAAVTSLCSVLRRPPLQSPNFHGFGRVIDRRGGWGVRGFARQEVVKVDSSLGWFVERVDSALAPPGHHVEVPARPQVADLERGPWPSGVSNAHHPALSVRSAG